MSKITPRVVCTASQLARASRPRLAQTVERRAGPEGLERSGAICRLGPPRGLVGVGRAPDDELPVARPCELVGELADPLRREVGERRRQLLVVLVLEPREALHAAQDRGDFRRILLPGSCPALLVGVLGTDFEEEPDGVARDRDLVVAWLLVVALGLDE